MFFKIKDNKNEKLTPKKRIKHECFCMFKEENNEGGAKFNVFKKIYYFLIQKQVFYMLR